ncbi:MAG TPA: hypothetical protein VLK84_03155 [Longimicrobium sp.]|nr:hypothetical protein [Longimicrobium sp.]
MENQQPKHDEQQLPEDEEPREPFRLTGSVKLLVPPDALEAGIAAERKRQAELFEGKMRRWFED